MQKKMKKGSGKFSKQETSSSSKSSFRKESKSMRNKKQSSFKLPNSQSFRNLEQRDTLGAENKNDFFDDKSEKMRNEVTSFRLKSNLDLPSPKSAIPTSPMKSPIKKKKRVPLEFDPKNTTFEKAMEKCFVMDLDPEVVAKAEETEKKNFGYESNYQRIRVK